MKLFRWVLDRLKHKLSHFSWTSIKRTLKENGLALVIIIIGWEIIEDVLFPLLFMFLGNYVHPVFFTGIPVSWLLCLHWLAVPIIWSMWIKFSGKKE